MTYGKTIMMRRLLCIGTLIALSCPAALAEDDYVPSDQLHDAGLAKFWQLQLPLEPDQAIRDAYLVDSQLYLGTDDGYVYAVDAYTGVIRWVREVTRSAYNVRRPCHANGQVVFVTPINIQVYDVHTGAPLRTRSLRFPAATSATTDGRRLFIGGLDARLYALDRATLFTAWRVFTMGPIASDPAVYGDQVFVANEDGLIYSCTQANKAFRWRAATYGPISANLVVDETGVYAACRDQALYLFDRAYGSLRWHVRLSSPLYEPPYTTPDLVLQYNAADGVVAIETGLPHEVKNRIRWTVPQGRHSLTTDPRRVYLLSDDDEILVVDKADGEIEHAVPTEGLSLAVPAPDATILLAAADGRIFCARPRDVPFLKKQDILEALRAKALRDGDTEEADEPVPTTQPADAIRDFVGSKQRGKPLGGKSKISREFTGE